MSDITTKDKEIMRLQSEVQSIQQRMDLNKATSSFLRPLSPKGRADKAERFERELKSVQEQYAQT